MVLEPAQPACDRRGALAMVAYAVLLVACAALSLTWLAVGAVVGVAAQVPSFAAALATAAAQGDRWAQGILAAVPISVPAAQALLDYGFSVLSIVIAVVLNAGHRQSWSTRLLVLAMFGSAGAFNLQAHAASTAVETATGLQIGMLHQVLLHGVACAAYIVALLLFPPVRRSRPGGAARTVLVLAGTGTLLLVGFGTALLPHTTSCVLFFGFLVPLVGLGVLPRQIRDAPTVTARTQARLLFSALATAFAITAVLAVITVLLWSTGWSGAVVDPTSHAGGPGSGGPMTLLFWFSRAACIAVAGAVFIATRQGDLWTAERLFSRGLAAGLTAALVGGGYVVVRRTVATLIEGGAPVAPVIATVLAALALRPVYVYAERLADRLLFGTRPTPYSVLAGVAALSRGTATDAPDLARVAEAVGRGLGARTCRLTVRRPGLRDRSYTWSEAGHDPDELVEVVVRHGSEAIGALAVDYDAVAGVESQRQHLLEDLADSLGVVLQASRLGIDLERQLRAALAHAEEIAVSRRAVVAEMDRERRRIERDLHDGAQHHLVSLRLTLGLVEHQVSTAQFDDARARLEQVVDKIDMAESILAETAMGVSAPLLAELGLVRALEKELAGGQPPVAVDASGVDTAGRFPHDVESAVYFCCLEAVNNARKHARGAAIDVRLRIEDGRLRFVVQDEGPGWDQDRVSGSPGRGMRNLTARISAVGGRIEVRSALGKGTTVEGSVPLPEIAEPRPTPARPVAAVAAAVPLLDQVRDAVREARELYHGTALVDAVRVLAERLDAPLRIGVSGGEGSGGLSGLVQVLTALDAPMLAGAVLVDAAARAPAPPADAFVLLFRRDADNDLLLPDLPSGSTPHRPAHAVGALLLDGPVDEAAQRAAAVCAARRDVRRLCHVVEPVSPAFAQAGIRLTDEEYGMLQALVEDDAVAMAGAGAGRGGRGGAGAPSLPVLAPEPHVAFGPGVVQFAVAAIRSGRAPTRQALAAALVQHSGVPRLHELVAEQLTRRSDALRARSVLLVLEDLVRREPPKGGDALRYRLDRIRSGAHELTELDVVDALRAGELHLPDEERLAAERLLGAFGADLRTRLGLAPGAGQQEVLRSAQQQLAHWRRRAANPLAGPGARNVADVLVQTCERLLAEAAERRP
jgi:signal transduction histidine kinase